MESVHGGGLWIVDCGLWIVDFWWLGVEGGVGPVCGGVCGEDVAGAVEVDGGGGCRGGEAGYGGGCRGAALLCGALLRCRVAGAGDDVGIAGKDGGEVQPGSTAACVDAQCLEYGEV